MRAQPPLGAGERVGPYEIGRAIGVGAIGVLYRARRRLDGGAVVLRVLSPQLSGNPGFVPAFEHEVDVARRLPHPHLVAIDDVGTDDGRCWLAMRYVEGETLAELLSTAGTLPRRRISRIVAQVGGALDALHASGLVHRDLRPSNVLLDRAGEALLADYGIARGRAYAILSSPGEVMGALAYQAPEILLGSTATPASDVYALGCVAYECATGLLPFTRETPHETIVATIAEEPPPPTGEAIGETFGRAILRALAKEPSDRPPTAAAYAALLAASGR